MACASPRGKRLAVFGVSLQGLIVQAFRFREMVLGQSEPPRLSQIENFADNEFCRRIEAIELPPVQARIKHLVASS